MGFWRASGWFAAGLACLLALLVAGTGRAQGNAALHLQEVQFRSVAGEGFSPAPLNPDLPAGTDAGWATVGLPHIQMRELVPDAHAGERTATDWYRLVLPTTRAENNAPQTLYIPRWKTIGQIAVYGDGRLLYASEGSYVHNGYNHPLMVALAPGAAGATPAEILLRIDRLTSSGSALSTLWVGDAGALTWRYQVRQWLQIQLPYMGSAAFLAVGAFALAVWLGRRRETLYLLFFVTSVAGYVRTLHYYTGGTRLPLADASFEWITVSSLLWLVVLVHLFLQRLHKRRHAGVDRLLVGVMLVCTLLISPAVAALPSVVLLTPLVNLLLLPVALGIFASALYSAWHTRSREVGLMASWIFASAACGGHDVALQNNWIGPESLYVIPYAIIGLFVMFTYVMFRRYREAIQSVRSLNAQLADRVRHRERELEESHSRLRVAEHGEMLSRERQRLMRDMHDGVGSSLAIVIHSVQHSGLDRQQLGGLLQDCMDGLKLAIDSMEPVETDLLLLLATLRFRLAPRIESAGIRLHWQVQDLPALAWLEPASALHILRILQEAFANVLRHAGARTIRVETAATPDGGVMVAIEDDGRGFAPPDPSTAPAHGAGRGLHNQRHRAAVLQGRVSWDTGSAGTRFQLWLPLRHDTATGTA